MTKQMIYGEDARHKLLEGIDTVTNAVKVTLGPKARTVVLDKSWGSPTIINDGVSIAKDIDVPDKFVSMGIRLVREAATKTQDKAGDGTSTAAVLTQALATHGLRNVAAGASPTDLKEGFDTAIVKVVDHLRSAAVPVDSDDMIRQVASIAANNDSGIGDLIAEAVEKVGHEGVITVEEAKSLETSLKVVEGMEFDKGYVSPYMITDREKREAILESPAILLTDQTISAAQDLVPALEAAVQQKKPLLIIAKDVEGEALATLVLNVASKVVKACAVKAPGFGDEQGDILEDLALLTGGTVIAKDKGMELKNVGFPELGSSEKVVVAKSKTTVVDGVGSEDAIAERVDILRGQAKLASSDWDREKIEKRIGKLTGGVAVLSVGAATETEMKEKKERVDDALNATRAAMAEGVVIGGGVALLNTMGVVDTVLEGLDGDRKIGAKIVRDALVWPTKQISINAGEDGSVVVNNIVSQNDPNYGFNARTNTFEDIFASGVIDPVKVTRNAIQAAGSIAGMVLTTEVLVTDSETKDDMGADMGGDMGGMGGMGGMPGMF